MTIVFASANQNKIREIKAIMPKHITVLGLTDVGITDDIPETGKTIRENAFLKAKYVSNFLKSKNQNMPVFADDSGLEVEALQGAPGVYSARYAGVPKSDQKNNEKLLRELKDVTKRQARFVTVIAYVQGEEEKYFEGIIQGTISYEARGNNGFGYDPLFIPRAYRSTFAELSAETKNSISHRALAVKQFIGYLGVGNL
jgi:XTP/dITP diphosphohydrolase